MKRLSLHNLNPSLQKRFSERAALFAKTTKTRDTEEQLTYIKFTLHQECYGIHLQDCAQTLLDQTITQIPFSPSFINGVIHYDGAFLPVVDLLQFFGYDSMPRHDKQSVIMINHARISFGVLVNNIAGQNHYVKAQLTESLRDEFAKNKKYIVGIHGGNTAILNVNAIVEDIHAQ